MLRTLQNGWKPFISHARSWGVETRFPILAALAVLGACGPAGTASRYGELGMCGGPPRGWLQPSDGIGDHRILLSVRIDRDSRLHWHGSIVSRENLSRYLEAAGAMDPPPQIALVVEEGADCRAVAEVRRLMADTAICEEDRLCGEGRGWNP